VRFIGYRVSYREKIQKVSTGHLLPYNYGYLRSEKGTDDWSGHDTRTVVNCSETASIETSSDKTDSQLKQEKDWNTNLMSMYLKSLQSNQKEFKTNNSNDSVTAEYKLKVEEQFLQVIASSVFEREQEHNRTNDALLRLDDAEVDNESIREHSPTATPPSKTDSPIIATSDNGKKRQPTVTTVTKLRAGDVIEYWYVFNIT
jgi:hypothetical protein